MPAVAWAAISGTTGWEVNGGGSDSANGGGFDPANASMATDLAATLATGTAPVVTSASYNFTSRDNGAWLFVQAGTNWTKGWYQIASTSGNAATLTATIGSAYLYNAGPPMCASTAAGCATVASPTGGTWSIDYSQSTAAGITYTDMVIGGTTTQYTSAGNPVGPNIVGNIVAVTSGTNFTVQRVQISSVSGTTATCDKSLGTAAATGGHGGLGGALASPGMASGLSVSGNWGAVRNTGSPTVYTISNTSNVSGGKCAPAGSSIWFGYGSHRFPNNTDTRPQFNASANNVVYWYIGGGNCGVRNFDITNTGAFTGLIGVQLDGNNGIASNCKVTSCNRAFYGSFGPETYENCNAISCVLPFELSSNGRLYCCVASSSVAVNATIFNLASNSTASLCVADGGSGQGFSLGSNTILDRCVARGLTGSTGVGFLNGAGATIPGLLYNCVAVGCSHEGFKGSPYGLLNKFINCASYNNSADYDAATVHLDNLINFKSLTADPFTNSAGGDYSPNTTAGGGAVLRAAGFPASLPGLSTNSYLDIGAAQHPDPAGGGGKKVGPGGGKLGLTGPAIRLRKAG